MNDASSFANWVGKLEARMQAVDAEPSEEFGALVKAAGLSPSRDLRFGKFVDARFLGETLADYDFTGCDLTDAHFDGAHINGAIFDCARVSLGALAKAADFADYLKWELDRPAGKRHPLDPSRLPNLAAFREAPFAPEMVVIPAGEFLMGSDREELALPDDDKAYEREIGPGGAKRPMRIARRFALGRYPVTFDEYDIFTDARGHRRAEDPGNWGRGVRPVIYVSWDDAQAYVDWLNERSGHAAYRLPSEAEWEYACRAGTDKRRWWEDAWDPEKANGAGSFKGGRTSPVGHFEANPWGLHDMIGNVWEWCADIWTSEIANLPEGGAALGPSPPLLPSKSKKTKHQRDSVARRPLRGGAWSDVPWILRSAIRSGTSPVDRGVNTGFRLSRTL